MFKATSCLSSGLLALGIILFVPVGEGRGQETPGVRVIKLDKRSGATLAEALAVLMQEKDKKPYEKHDASALHNSLRDVINTGARMFNEQGDHAGCYRLYQGSLLSVRAFLSADLQKKIDQGIAKSDQLPTYADRAFELRRVLDEIRASTKPGGGAVGTKDPPAGDKGQVSGRLTFQDQPVTGGYFVTLVGAGGKKFSSAIQKDGSFSFKTPIPAGAYTVMVEPIPGDTTKTAVLPARYRTEGSSGLTVNVQAGKLTVNLNLVN